MTTKKMLKVRFSMSPIFEMIYNKTGLKNRSIVHVISKLINALPSLLMFLILPFFDVHNIKGIRIPSNGKKRKVKAERLRNAKYFLSSFTDQSISSSGFMFRALANRLSDSPVGLDSPFSIL